MTTAPTSNLKNRRQDATPNQEITTYMLLKYLQCQKRLWLETHGPQYGKPSARPRSDIEAFNTLRWLHRQRYGGSATWTTPIEDMCRLRPSSNLPKRPLFDASFLNDHVRVHADVLVPVEGGWRLVSVKSSASVKKTHVAEAAIQAYVLGKAGMVLSQICIAHVDTGFLYAGDGDYSSLVVEDDVTSIVRELLPDVPTWIEACRNVLNGGEPSVVVGAACKKPACEFLEYCRQSEPAFPVSLLPNGRHLIKKLLADGINDLRDVPRSSLKAAGHVRVWEASRTGKPFLSPELQKKFAALPYPRFYLDFETINLTIPRWKGVHPHQHVPFQWSCHVERSNGVLSHGEFLDTEGSSPMKAFAESLLAATHEKGPVIVYGVFEGQVLSRLADVCPDLKDDLGCLRGRLVNIHPWLQEYYYHTGMKGSWSIKNVLPTVASHLAYEDLENVRNGMEAQAAYLDIIDGATDSPERELKIANLLEYCKLDSLALFEIVRFFQQETVLGGEILYTP